MLSLDEKKLKKEFADENFRDNAKQKMTAFMLLNQLDNEMNEKVVVICNGVAINETQPVQQVTSQGNIKILL